MRKISLFIRIALMLVIPIEMSSQVLSPADGRKADGPTEYFRGDLSGFQVSPAGKGVAFLRYENDRWALYWDNINGGRETRVSKSDEANVVDFRWVGDDVLVYSTGLGDIGTELHRYEVFTKAYNRLTSTPVWIKFLDSHYFSSGTTLLIRDVNDVTSAKAYSIQPGMRELNHIASGHGVNWIEGLGNGATYYIQKTEEGSQFIRCSVNAGEKLGVVKGFCSLKGLLLASKSNESVYVLNDCNRNYNALVKMNMKDGTETEVIFENNQSMITKVLFSPITSKPLVVWYDGMEKGFQCIDKEFESTFNAITSKLPTLHGFDIVHSDLSTNVWIVSIINPGGGRVYYHYNAANLELNAFRNQMLSNEITPVAEVLSNGSENFMVRYYTPQEIDSKTLAVLVFRDAPWMPSNASGMDALVQRLVQGGMLVAEIDLGYSENSRSKLMFSGYDQLVDRVIAQIPMIQKSMSSTYGLSKGMLSVVGEGIGCRAAMRVVASHTSIVLRSVFIDAAPELKGYLMSQFPIERETRDYVMGYGEVEQKVELSYIAREPLFVYSGSKGTYYTSNIEPALKKLTQGGKSPESFIVGSGFGSHFSSVVVNNLGDKLVNYLRN